MAIITYPLNNIEYTAEDAELYHATRTSGVFANDDFPITVSGDGNVVTIGRYTTARRAKEVMQLIKKAIQDKVTVFEMP